VSAVPETGRWPGRRTRTLDWLARDSVLEPYIDNLFGGVCNRLREDGLPLERATLHLRTLHPQLLGATITWRPGMRDAEIVFHERRVLQQPRYLNSPVRALFEGAEGIRQRLDLDHTVQGPAFEIFADLRDQGFTDYLALPMRFTDGRRHASSWATRRPGGFRPTDLLTIEEMLPVLAMAIEIRLNRRIARNLLNTYVGPRAGERILRGEITRGSGETLHAAIWNSDLRGFTRLSQSWPRDALLDLLNGYFDVMADAVLGEGGEILKFMGDGLLAIFPLDTPRACARAFRAARAAVHGMHHFNETRRSRGEESVGFGIALHRGDVMWGNIGAASRLDFTVIGPAVNVTERLQELTKELRVEVLLSGEFVHSCEHHEAALHPLGRRRLRDIDEAIEIYTILEEEAAASG